MRPIYFNLMMVNYSFAQPVFPPAAGRQGSGVRFLVFSALRGMNRWHLTHRGACHPQPWYTPTLGEQRPTGGRIQSHMLLLTASAVVLPRWWRAARCCTCSGPYGLLDDQSNTSKDVFFSPSQRNIWVHPAVSPPNTRCNGSDGDWGFYGVCNRLPKAHFHPGAVLCSYARRSQESADARRCVFHVWEKIVFFSSVCLGWTTESSQSAHSAHYSC